MGLNILAVALVTVFYINSGVTELYRTTKGRLSYGKSVLLMSPNYQDLFPDKSVSSWYFKSPKRSIINLKCSEFDLPRTSGACIDTFYFSPTSTGKRNDLVTGYCGRINFDLNTTQNRFYAKFKTIDGFISYNSRRRFNCTITAYRTSLDPVGCGENHLHNRIVGGDETQTHEWPWMVALRYMDSQTQFCGGSLISPDWVLTAAHCLRYVDKNDIYLSIGEHDLSTGNDTFHTLHDNISQIIIHKGYANNTCGSDDGAIVTCKNDIALLKLADPVRYSYGISPVCLPTKTFAYKQVVSTGWGSRHKHGNGTDILNGVSLWVLPNNFCNHVASMNNQPAIVNSQICATRKGKSSCHGDSGGPLVWLDDDGRYQVVGIVADGLNPLVCASSDKATLAATYYTRVTSFIDWILQETNMYRLRDIN